MFPPLSTTWHYRTLVLLVVCMGMVAGAVSPASAHNSKRDGGQVACRLLFHGGDSPCYPPAQLPEAERQMPAPPVDASSVVFAQTGISLTQVAVVQGPAVVQIGQPRYVIGILYLFGTIPGNLPGVPNPSPSSPKWVIVEEMVGRYQGLTGTVLTRVTGYSCQPACPPSQQASPHPPTPLPGQTITTWYGNWEFEANLPNRPLALHVMSNLDGSIVANIGQRIVEAAQSGKRTTRLQVPGVKLGHPLERPRMNQKRALKLAEQHLATQLFSYPHRIRYGSWRDWQSGQVRDVWEIVVTGLKEVRSDCGGGLVAKKMRCPPLHALVILIDDRARQYLEAIAY